MAHKWKLIWEIYHFSFQTHKTHIWESCTNLINGILPLTVFSIYLQDIFENPHVIIEIINNTRGGIEGKIGERGNWGANSSPGCSLIHNVPDKKSRFRRVFQLFFALKILKISFQTV